MRLSKFEIKTIKETVAKYDDQADVWLFGSRTDLNKLGGDIDLIILSQKLTAEKSMYIRQDLWDELGFQRIDIIIDKDENKPFIKIALEGGIKL